jgi:carotenoid 1,2-hydratase
MNRLELPALPTVSGSYRWLYADVACGDVTAVFIFMLGSIFSPRYSAALSRGGLPLSHCAVNFALYQGGERRLWVLSEYDGAALEDGGRTLRIGRSTIGYGPSGDLRVQVRERTAPWGRPAEATLTLTPRCQSYPELALDPKGRHFWRPLAARADARLVLPLDGLALQGHGYHDTNHGEEPLGRSLTGWRWSRVHRSDATYIDYHVDGESRPIQVVASERDLVLIRGDRPAPFPEHSTWGLKVPKLVRAGKEVLSTGTLLEGAPFYARYEARERGAHVLGEVADFRRFHSPFIRWMAHFRTRVEEVA